MGCAVDTELEKKGEEEPKRTLLRKKVCLDGVFGLQVGRGGL